MPGSGLPRSVGNHDSVVAYGTSDWPIPTPKPARQAIQSELKPANKAAASAGTMKSTSVVESAWASGAATMPIAPASADASTVFAIESWFGDSPASIAEHLVLGRCPGRQAEPCPAEQGAERERDQHDHARHPEPVHRDRRAEDLSTMSFGKTLGIDCDAEPNQSSIVAWRISRIPSEATSLASGDDVRSGRNTSSSLSTPTRIATAIVTIAAGTVPNVTWK